MKLSKGDLVLVLNCDWVDPDGKDDPSPTWWVPEKMVGQILRVEIPNQKYYPKWLILVPDQERWPNESYWAFEGNVELVFTI